MIMPQIDFKKLVRSGFRLSAFAIGIASALLSFAPFPVQPTSARATAVPASNPIDTLNPGEWYRVPNSNLSAVLPNPLPPGGTGPASLMVAWNSCAYDTARDRLLIWGGGHADY